MTFNQWCAVCHINDNSERLAFEGIWNAMVGNETSPSTAAALLTDLVEALPDESDQYPDEED